MPDVVSFCQELVRTPSLSGQEADVARAVTRQMAALGYGEIDTDEYGDVIGIRRGREPGPTLLLDGHMDTVAAVTPERWQRPPWSGEIESGRLWGLGAADTKGSLAAMIFGAASLAGDAFRGQIVVVASVCEENMTAAALGQILERHPADMVVTGEPTQLMLGMAQKGRVEVLLDARGRSAHTSHPEQGDNAVYKMIDAIGRVRALPQPADPLLGRGILELVEMVSEPLPGTSHVPHGCRARFLGRTMPEETSTSILQSLAAALAGLPGVSVELERSEQRCYTGALLTHSGLLPGWRMAPNAPWLAHIQGALRQAGLESRTFGAAYGTNGSASGPLGIPTLICGPGSLDQAHVVDEWIEVEQLALGARSYATIAAAFLSLEAES